MKTSRGLCDSVGNSCVLLKGLKHARKVSHGSESERE